MKKNIRFTAGFTLLEMLLVLVIVSIMIVMSVNYIQEKAYTTRVDRTVNQMQQILSASLAYYVGNNQWPSDLNVLQTLNYLPATPNPLMSPWGTPYILTTSSTPAPSVINVSVQIPASPIASSTATLIAGGLPLALTAAEPPTTPNQQLSACTPKAACYVVASANIPGQNLNNAGAINFAGVYHNSACVPAPVCPVDANGQTMTPEVFVVPISLSGVTDASSQTNVYPISSFTAYVSQPTAALQPAACTTSTPAPCYQDNPGGAVFNTGTYWRVCAQVITEKGLVDWGSSTSPNNWGQYAVMAAFTRCASANEDSGSGFKVWGS